MVLYLAQVGTKSQWKLKPWMSGANTRVLNLWLHGLRKHQEGLNECPPCLPPAPLLRTVTGRLGERGAVSMATRRGGRNIFF